MRPDDIKEQAENEHDDQCAYGADCHSRDKHIHSAYIPRIQRERLRAAEKEISKLRGSGWVNSIKAEALREAARDTKARGDIGKEGGVEAWDYLHGRADRLLARYETEETE